MDFAKSLKQLRTNNDYTQERLAAICGVSRQAVTKWERGTNLPDLDKILQLARLFNVSVDELLTGSKPVVAGSKEISTDNVYADNEKIVNQALRTAMSYDDPDEELNQFISYIGNKIGCDRMYVFERNPDSSYRNTYEWCHKGVQPQLEYLQNIPLDDVSPWLRAFSRGEYVFIADLETIAETDPVVYRWLKPQGIHSLLVYPLFGGRCFMGVDNPAPAFIGQTSSLLEIMLHFMESMIQRRDLTRELRQTVQQRQQVLEANKGIYFQINMVSGQLTYDRTMAQELGYTLKLQTMEQLEDFASGHPEFHDHLMIDGIQHVMDSKENLTIQFISYRDNRQIRWNKLSISPFVNSDGTVLQLYGVLQDSSAEHQIVTQYNKYITHLSGGLHICYLSRPIHLDYASDDLCEFSGYDRDEFERLVGTKYVNLIVEEDRPIFSAYANRLAERPGIQSCEYRIRCKDGSIVQVIDTMESIMDCNGIMYGYAYILAKSKLHAMLEMAEENERHHLAVIDRQYEVLDSLARDYLNVFRIWLDEDKAQIVKLNGYVTKGMNRESDECIPYYRFCQQYIQDRVHPEDRNKMSLAMRPDTVRRAFSESDEYIVVYRAIDQGEAHFYQMKYVRLHDPDHADRISFVAGFKNVDIVIGEERRQKEELQNRLNIINAILQVFTCGYYYGYEDDTFIDLSNSEWPISQLIGRNGSFTENRKRMEQLFPDKDAFYHIDAFIDPTTLNARLNGRKFISDQVYINGHGWYELYIFVVDYDEQGNVSHCITAARDISREKQQEEEYIRSLGIANKRERTALQYAYTDTLTGVMNRNAYERDIRALTGSSHVGFVYCDVNRLKEVNNTQGHSQGDQLLQTFANLLKEHFSVDCIYRTGGDEFVCMIVNIDEVKFDSRVSGFIQAVAAEGNIAAVGAAFGTSDGKQALIRQAEVKMYQMKRGTEEGDVNGQ